MSLYGDAEVQRDVQGAFAEARRTVRLARDGVNEIEDSIARGLRALGDVELGRGVTGVGASWEAVGDGLRELARHTTKGVEAGIATQEFLAQARWSVGAARVKLEGAPPLERHQSHVDQVALGERAQKLGRLIDQADPAVEEATGALRRTAAMARNGLDRVERLAGPDVETMSRTLLSSFAAGTNAQTELQKVSTGLAQALGHVDAAAAGSRSVQEARRAQPGRGPEPAGGISP